MELNLRGKTVLITGGSKGIGKAVAEVFVEEGADVHLVARDAATLAATADKL
ncbi:MAG: SDR family NAD(P)-dependent oxidoreductase, partial [Pseudomonadota bacterium]|nr:SDR family NAD(P)-dependent oxidoreductase [Pseudomonadota bacterium]